MAEVIHEGAPAAEHAEPERAALRPHQFSKRALTNDDFLTVRPLRSVWLVELRGEYMGSVRKRKDGSWKIASIGGATTGRPYEACAAATLLLDAYFTKPKPLENPVEAPCCTPQVEVVRPEAYNACLADAARLGPIRTARKAFLLVRSLTDASDQELLLVVPLDARYQLRGGVIPVHKGTRAAVQVCTVDVLRAVLLSGCSSYILIHSHPSGKASPSPADRHLTKAIERATKVATNGAVLVLDHVIAGRGEYFSFREDKLSRVK